MGKIEFTSGGNLGIGTGIRIPTTIDVNGSVSIMPFGYNPTEKIVFKTDGECRINATTWPELPININGSVVPLGCNQNKKLVIREHKHLEIGHEVPKHKLDIKGKLSLKSKLILFYKRYFK